MMSGPKTPPVILTIDDDQIIRTSFRYFLEDLDYKVLEAENGKVGIRLFEQENPDLVLVDLRMPEIDGLEVLKYIRDISPDTPLIVISGTGAIADAVEALRLGAWDYLLKPVEDMSVVIHAIEKAMDRARLILENRQYQQHLEEQIALRTAELEQAYAVLSESEEKFSKIFQASPDAVFIMKSSNNGIVDVNEAFTQIFGYSREAACGKTVLELGLWTDSAEVSQVLERLLAMGICVNHATMFIAREARMVPVLFSARTVEFAFAKDSYIIAIAKDMSEQRLLETQLLQAQKMESIGRLAGGVAHDFNNLLTPILGYTELALIDLPSDDKHYDLLKTIHRAAENAKGLTRQLLAFGRKQVLEMKPVDLKDVVANFLKILRRTIREDIDIRINLRDELVIKADVSQIEQVLMNLAVNAQDAMPDGGIISIDADRIVLDPGAATRYPGIEAGLYAVLLFRDTGTGITTDVMDNLFEPFFTTKAAGKGTGLGLSTVYGIVQQHGGGINVDSSPGKGTSFKILLPLQEDTLAKEVAEPLPKDLGGLETIVVVEDNTMVRELAIRMLEDYGYQVVAVEDPGKCLAAVESVQKPVDLLLTDVVMPRMNGRELYSTLQQQHPSLKVVYMSGYSDDAIAHHGVLAEGVHFVQKPFSTRQLLEKVREAIDG